MKEEQLQYEFSSIVGEGRESRSALVELTLTSWLLYDTWVRGNFQISSQKSHVKVSFGSETIPQPPALVAIACQANSGAINKLSSAPYVIRLSPSGPEPECTHFAAAASRTSRRPPSRTPNPPRPISDHIDAHNALLDITTSTPPGIITPNRVSCPTSSPKTKHSTGRTKPTTTCLPTSILLNTSAKCDPDASPASSSPPSTPLSTATQILTPASELFRAAAKAKRPGTPSPPPSAKNAPPV
ncbi:37S ribosomal protein S12 [Zalerion maritima]|uniref:37S ribosomal protein S12 n=1 Tax=Zalerion maritima TaxID=339359 RepID=A0AAD5RIZ6_9PEZI|nr:37S ribosomal protein S12 [Zalerion maritima]